jgi:hypothetical protein
MKRFRTSVAIDESVSLHSKRFGFGPAAAAISATRPRVARESRCS